MGAKPVITDTYAADTLLDGWHVALGDLGTICTDRGVAVAVQPRYVDKNAWAVVAQAIVDAHNQARSGATQQGPKDSDEATQAYAEGEVWTVSCRCGWEQRNISYAAGIRARDEHKCNRQHSAAVFL